MVPMIKNLSANAGDTRDTGSILGSGRSPGVGNGNPLQYSCLENPIDRGAWWVIDHQFAKSWTRLSLYARAHTHTHTHTHTAVSFHHICLLHVTSCLDDYTSLLPVQSCSPPTPALLKHQPAHFLFWRGSPLPADKAQFA